MVETLVDNLKWFSCKLYLLVETEGFWATMAGTILGAWLAVRGAIKVERRKDLAQRLVMFKNLSYEWKRIAPGLVPVVNEPRTYVPVRLPILDRLMSSGTVDAERESELFEALVALEGAVQRFNTCVEVNNRATTLAGLSLHPANLMRPEMEKRVEELVVAWSEVEKRLPARHVPLFSRAKALFWEIWDDMGRCC